MPSPTQPGRDPILREKPARSMLALGVVLLIMALGFMLWRGPYRAMLSGGSSDFSLIWMSTRAWVEGKSPYTVGSTGEVWEARAGVPAGEEPPSERSNALLVYPPSTFPILAPWCLTDWPRSALLWAATGTFLLLGSVVLTLGVAGLSPRRPAWWFAAAGMLVLAPGHTAISVGQVSILVYFMIILAQALRQAGWSNACGVLLGLACAVKPQVGLLFLVYELGRRRWRVAIAAAFTIAAVAAFGMFWLARAGVDWVPAWRANLDAFANSNNANPTAANALRYHLINLHLLLHGFLQSVGLVKALVLAACGGLCLGYFLADLRKPQDRGEILSLSFVAAIAMLVVYHRMYDAVVLLLPAAWLARELTLRARHAPAGVVALGLAAFLAPGASLLHSLAASGRIPASVAGAWWFEALVVPHAVIALLALALALLAARARGPGPAAP